MKGKRIYLLRSKRWYRVLQIRLDDASMIVVPERGGVARWWPVRDVDRIVIR